MERRTPGPPPGANRGAIVALSGYAGQIADGPTGRLACRSLRGGSTGWCRERQLLALGLGTSAIGEGGRSGPAASCAPRCLCRRLSGLTRNGHFMAAVLACGDGAALSHLSAAVLWGILSGGGRRDRRHGADAAGDGRGSWCIEARAGRGRGRRVRRHPGHRPRPAPSSTLPTSPRGARLERGHRRGRVPAARLHRPRAPAGPARRRHARPRCSQFTPPGAPAPAPSWRRCS